MHARIGWVLMFSAVATASFAADGTFTALVDCNTLAGSYTTADPAQATGDLTLVPGPFTSAACPPGSFGDR